MKAIKVVGIVLLLLVVAVFVFIYTLPETAHMEREILIDASPSKVYHEIVSFRNFSKWSPWASKAPTASYTYSGPEFGPGAKISWESDNPDVGTGSMEILLADKNKRVVCAMRFDGYESTPRASMVLRQVEGGTLVTWTYDEEDVTGLSKIFMLGIDGFLGGDFALGLELLKARVEKMPNFNFEIELDYVPSFDFLGVRDSSLNEPGMINTKMARAFGDISSYMSRNNLEPLGPRLALFLNESDFDVTFVSGIPSMTVDSVKSETIQLYHQDSALVLIGHYIGNINELGKGHEQIKKFASFYNYDIVGNPWESYITDPSENPDTSSWKTHISYPVR
ncbi:MAG: SRPBCC family protein [Marinoscillum sp.]